MIKKPRIEIVKINLAGNEDFDYIYKIIVCIFFLMTEINHNVKKNIKQ